jgi:DNA-binding transcriptional ArsR family regulator
MSNFAPPFVADDEHLAELRDFEAFAAWSLGKLDGLLGGLDAQEATLFCASLVREVLLSALDQAGYPDARMRFDSWFCGCGRGPDDSPVATAPPPAIVQAILAELGYHSWAPLAEVASIVTRMNRFGSAGAMDDERETLNAACTLVRSATKKTSAPLPFAHLAGLNSVLRQSSMFAPIEAGLSPSPFAGPTRMVERRALRTPLWAVCVQLGQLLVESEVLSIPLPCPDAIRAEALQPRLNAMERAIQQAQALNASASRMVGLASAARVKVLKMRSCQVRLRSTARAPQLWLLLEGFGPMTIGQVVTALEISRRGVYAVLAPLEEAGLIVRRSLGGKVTLNACQPAHEVEAAQLPPLPSSPALYEFNAAMDAVDQLLSRQGKPS